MLHRIIFFSLLSFCLFLNAAAQNIDSLFINTPRHIMPLLDQTSKMDLLDLYDYNGNLRAKVENIYGGETVLLKKTGNYLSLKTTDTGNWTIKIFRTDNDSPIILCAHSVEADGISTDLKCFNMNWGILKIQLPHPSKDSFLKKVSSYTPINQQELVSSILELPIEVIINDNDDTLVYQLSLSGLTNDKQQLCKDIIRSIVYKWNGSGFIQIKQ